eukprot:COSAG01_NODE_3982_length_5467_cov_3.487891_10_plen_49_part_00
MRHVSSPRTSSIRGGGRKTNHSHALFSAALAEDEIDRNVGESQSLLRF